MTEISVAVIGCGAVTQLGYLPAVARVEDVRVTLLVDKNRSGAEQLARQYNVPHVTEDYSQVWDKAHAAIVALPHYLHAPVSVDLLAHGVHVLVEKPMALSVAESDAMIRAAERGQAVLAVGLMRRFLWSARFTKEVLKLGILGKVEHFDFQEGSVYNWPVASDFFFRKDKAGGGVLMDTGAHTLDLLLWWLGDVDTFDYYDDSYGNVEANCEIHLKMQSGAQGTVCLSRTRRLRNTAIIQGTKGEIEVSLTTNQVTFRLRGASKFQSKLKVSGMAQLDGVMSNTEQPLQALLLCQLENWLHAIQTGQSPLVTGEQARRSISLIERCYRERKPLRFPWVAP